MDDMAGTRAVQLGFAVSLGPKPTEVAWARSQIDKLSWPGARTGSPHGKALETTSFLPRLGSFSVDPGDMGIDRAVTGAQCRSLR